MTRSYHRASKINRETVMNMWAGGSSVDAICAAVGTLVANTITSIVSEHRSMGDPRGARKGRGEGMRDANKAVFKSIKRRRDMAKLPVNPIQMMQAVASYAGPVTICRPGFHAGHSPRCLTDIAWC